MNTKNNRKHPLISRTGIGWTVSVLAVLGTVLASVSDAGITRNGIVSGRITRFGSIFVNNREFDISSASIILDGQTGGENDLRLGQVVFVRGLLDDTDPVGEAAEVIFADNVEGAITAIDANEESLTVLGLHVLTDVLTVFDLPSGGDSFDELDVDDQIEVSGFLTAEGEVLASRIEQKAAGGHNEVTGTVSNLTGTSFTFNTLTVDFSGAELINFPTGSIAEGDVAEVVGTDFGLNGELTALRVELKNGSSGGFGELGEFEGLITAFESPSSFSLGDVSVETNAETVYVGGGPGNLTANVSVQVAGTFDADGNLVANQVSVRGNRIRVHAEVDSVSNSSFTILGITAVVDSGTRWDDNSRIEADPFSLTNLYVGNYVEVRSPQNPALSTPFLARLVQREDPEQDVRLQGFVNFVSPRQFQVHGVTISSQNADFTDADDKKISAVEFFNRLAIGTFVKVTGAETTRITISADEVSFKLDD